MYVLKKEDSISAEDLLNQIKSKAKNYTIDDLKITIRTVMKIRLLLGRIWREPENNNPWTDPSGQGQQGL